MDEPTRRQLWELLGLAAAQMRGMSCRVANAKPADLPIITGDLVGLAFAFDRHRGPEPKPPGRPKKSGAPPTCTGSSAAEGVSFTRTVREGGADG